MIAGCDEAGKGEASTCPGLCPRERRGKEALGDFAKLHFKITKEL